MRPAASSRRRAPRGSNPRPANPTAPFPRSPRAISSGATPGALRINLQPSLPGPRADAPTARRATRIQIERADKDTMADDLSMNPSRDDFAALLDESLGGRDFMEGTVVKGNVVGDREGLRHHRRGPEDRGPHPGQGIRRRRRRQGHPEGRRHGRGVPRAGRERPGRGGDQPRQGPPRGGLDPPGRRLRQERAGDGLHRRPREGRLHRRPRRRLGLPAGQPGRHPPGARRRPADGQGAAVRDPEDGPPARQHRRLPPRHPGRSPRRTAHRAGQPAAARAKCAKAWSRTSPTTARSWTWAASTACCTSPT